MKSAAFCLCCLFAVANSQWTNSSDRKRINEEALTPTWHWIDLPLDHFNPFDNRTFRGRYLTNDQFYEKGGPIIVYVGGEWEISDYGVMGGVCFQLAKQHNGYLFYPEHRFFGQSLPFPKPVSIHDLRYINPDYSLADLVYSVSHIKNTVDGLANSQVVLVGGSYAGLLATWGRVRYPHIMSMAYACGGVIKTEVTNPDYFEVFAQSYKATNPECFNILQSGVKNAVELHQTENGKEKLKSMFPDLLCRIPPHGFSLPERIINSFNPQVWPVYKVRQICHYLQTNTTGTPLERMSQVLDRHITEKFKDEEERCDTGREWYALVCTYLGNIQTGNSSNFPDMFDYKKRVQSICTDLFGPDVTKDFVEFAVDRATKLNGGLKPDVTKVLSVQGTFDQWAPFSIRDDLNDEAPVVYIKEATHCLEVGEEQDDETPQVAQSKFEILEQLSKWLL